MMANTYSKIYVQVVFAVKGRMNLISRNHKDEIEKYITGIINNRGQKLLAIYCMPDHVHILFGLKPSIAISDLVRDIKAGSSGFINDKKWVKGKFQWQEGFGAFSYSENSVKNVIEYILNQDKHHEKTSFHIEYVDMLKKFNIDHEDQYLFDWLD